MKHEIRVKKNSVRVSNSAYLKKTVSLFKLFLLSDLWGR